MKTIIAGSRSLNSIALVNAAVAESGFEITEVVSGRAPGVDRRGEQWAKEHNVPVAPFPAPWANIKVSGAIVRRRGDGSRYNAIAGLTRNTIMADYADALVAVWDGKSTGTADMIQKAKGRGLKVYVKEIQ